MRFNTTKTESEAFKFETSRAVSLTEALNKSHHNNSFEVEFDIRNDTAIIVIYDSEYEIEGFVSSDVEVF